MPTATPSKRDQLVQTALVLFYEKGIHAVGINEILKTAGIAKKTLYTHFASKDDLILATIERRDAIFCQWFADALAGASSAEDGVQRLFHALDCWFHNTVPMLLPFRGCFFINASAEFSHPAHPVAKACTAHKNKVRQIIATQLGITTPAVLDLICMLKEGAIIAAHMQQDTAAAKKCIPIITNYLQACGLSKP
jgi:AcrR family transcriptional regulator